MTEAPQERRLSERLKKALDDLRSQLDADHDGNRGAWVALLLPFADPPSPPTTVVAGTVASIRSLLGAPTVKKTALAVIATLVFVVVGFELFGGPAEPDVPDRAGPDAPGPLADVNSPADQRGADATDSPLASSHAVLPYVSKLARGNLRCALHEDSGLAFGLNSASGQITHRTVSESLNIPYHSWEHLL